MLCGELYAADSTNGTVPVSGDGSVPLAHVALVETNGFGVQLFLVEGDKFFTDWEKPEPPHITPVLVARRGVPIRTVIVYVGAGLKSDGSADVTYDALVFKPDGSAYGRESDLTVAQGVDPAPGELHRACKYAGIRIEPKDPAGVYTVEVVVRDKVKKVELRLTRKFTVEE